MAVDLDSNLILQVDGLRTYFGTGSRVAKSVDGVSFSVRRGQTVAIVGESGSGKSVTSLSIMGLLSRPGKIVDGRILYRNRRGETCDLASLSQRSLRAIRGREISMVFQEPMTSLNPLYTIGQQIGEMIQLHEPMGRQERRAQAMKMLDLVEIADPARRLDEYPHRLSGGMRQRAMIALALACKPSLLIADEPTTALDVTVQAQILDLLRRLQSELGMSMLFITHNLGVVAEIAHEVVVMYAGRVVEQASVDTLFSHPRHPYTHGLLSCVPDARIARGGGGRRCALKPIPGAVPSITDLPDGCSFAPRCSYAKQHCATHPGPQLYVAGDNHLSRCWYHEAL